MYVPLLRLYIEWEQSNIRFHDMISDWEEDWHICMDCGKAVRDPFILCPFSN